MSETQSMLKQLAMEREARQRAAGVSNTTDGTGPAAYKPSQVAMQRQARGSGYGPSISSAHRTVRLAHTAGIIVCAFGVLFLLMFETKLWGAMLLLGGVALAKKGGAWFHNVIPSIVRDGSAPTESQMSVVDGIFHGKGPLAGENWRLEQQVALENLAYCCTYGKRNCLTNAMYTGELSLAKITSLVWGKLKDGTVNCG